MHNSLCFSRKNNKIFNPLCYNSEKQAEIDIIRINNMIADKIKSLRKLQNITQMDLAKKLKVSQPVLNRWETGVRNPSLKTLKKISEIFSISLDTLAFEKNELGKLKLKDKTLLSKLKDIEKLNENEKEMVINLIQTLAQKK